jgi:membrane protein DedA with SNARE-associated domain
VEHVSQFLSQYGYFAIFGLLMLGIVGPLIPDDTILVLSGIAAHEGRLELATTIMVAFAGSVCGITMSYTVGRTGAIFALRRIPILDRSIGNHLPRVEHWFEKYGKWTLFFGYFIAGVRHFTAVAAGMSKLRLRTFALYAYPGGLIWVISFVAIGYYLGEGWRVVAHRLNWSATAIAAGAIVVAALVWWVRRRRPID